MTDPAGIGTAIGLTAVAYQAVDKMISPAAERIGLSLFRVVDSFTTYQEENLRSVLAKWAARRNGSQLSDEELRKATPLLPLAAKEDNDDLQTRWAALLESAATSAKGQHLAFGQTLSQLSSEQAKFLENVYDCTPSESRFPSGFSFSRLHFQNPALTETGVLIDTLERLGVIRREVNVEIRAPRTPLLDAESGEASIADVLEVVANSEALIKYDFLFTGYAVRFVEACRIPMIPTPEEM